jgi:hypothetical protein
MWSDVLMDALTGMSLWMQARHNLISHFTSQRHISSATYFINSFIMLQMYINRTVVLKNIGLIDLCPQPAMNRIRRGKYTT